MAAAVGLLPVSALGKSGGEDMTLLPCPRSAADTAKAFFLTEDLRPSALLRLK